MSLTGLGTASYGPLLLLSLEHIQQLSTIPLCWYQPVRQLSFGITVSWYRTFRNYTKTFFASLPSSQAGAQNGINFISHDCFVSLGTRRFRLERCSLCVCLGSCQCHSSGASICLCLPSNHAIAKNRNRNFSPNFFSFFHWFPLIFIRIVTFSRDAVVLCTSINLMILSWSPKQFLFSFLELCLSRFHCSHP